MTEELELTRGMIERLDEIDGAISSCICVLAEIDEIANNDSDIVHEVADAIAAILAEYKMKLRSPCIVTDNSGNQSYGDWY